MTSTRSLQWIISLITAVISISIVIPEFPNLPVVSASSLQLTVAPSDVQATVGIAISDLYTVSFNGTGTQYWLYSNNPSTNEPKNGTAPPAGLSFSRTTGLLSGTPTHELATTKYWILDEDGIYYDDFTLTISLPSPQCPASVGQYPVNESVDVIFEGVNLGWGTPGAYPKLIVSQNGVDREFSHTSSNTEGDLVTVSLNQSFTRVSFSHVLISESGQFTATYKTSALTTCQTSITILGRAPEPSSPNFQSELVGNEGEDFRISVDIAPRLGFATHFQWAKGGNTARFFLSDDNKFMGSDGEELKIRELSENDEEQYSVIVTHSANGFLPTSRTFTVLVSVLIKPRISISNNSAEIQINLNSGFLYEIDNAGGQIDRFSISPSVPDGMLFDAHTGQLSGVPTCAQNQTQYSISAMNDAGISEVQFSLKVSTPVVDGVVEPVMVIASEQEKPVETAVSSPVESASPRPVAPLQKTTLPATGNNSAHSLWLSLLLVSTGGVFIVQTRRRRRENRQIS